ncbi:hypothetical protein CRN32_04690 [Vibrio vulnificus]|uniref:hypothetical protein n=1 Tax=Vibrio vulnificus TaxID=672 RepID=UPI000CD30011|nr:hypothetical protein [Vibrio vulnificus]POC59561.1 hypothetical protein CRN32_04690 [Vibrio vulnificus]
MDFSQFGKKYGANSAALERMTTSQKLECLNLSNDIDKIKGYHFETVWLEEEFSEVEAKINLSELAGINKGDNYDTWLDSLETLKKQDHFTGFTSIQDFENILVNPNNIDELPRVILSNGKYYIDGNGRHRLTIAKCLGLDTKDVKVKLRKL